MNYAIRTLDIIPTFLNQAKPLLLQFVADSAGDAHVSAQHTVDFRNSLQPFIGAPIDERLYQFGF